ncbi:MAG: tripartite tricarboxylate transporter substrate-binding protein [Bacteroidota bacterium]
MKTIVLLILLATVNLFAQFPQKPITIVVHSKPGSGIDITARQLVNIASKYTDATFLVENKTGGSGMIAMRNVLNKKADGYRILAVTKSFISTMQLTNAGISIDDFNWFAGMVVDPEVLIINRNSEIKTLEDIIADAKKRNGKQRWLGPLVGGLDHLMAVKTWGKLGIKGEWIPYEGGSDAIAALMGEHGVVYVGNPVDVKGRPDLMIAAVATPERLSADEFKDVPTFVEKGFDLKDEVLWRGFALKKGTDSEAEIFLKDIFKKVGEDTDWKKFIANSSANPVFWEKEEFTKIVNIDQKEALKYLTIAGVIGENAVKEKNNTGLVFGSLLFIYLLLLGIIYKTKNEWFVGDSVIAIGLLFLSGFVYYLTIEFPVGKLAGSVGPASMPRLWVYAFIFFSLWLLFDVIKNGRTINDEKRNVKKSLGLVFLMTGYLLLMEYFGYYLTTFIFLISGMYWMSYKRPIIMVVVSGGFLLLSYLAINKLLQVPLPIGVLFE